MDVAVSAADKKQEFIRFVESNLADFMPDGVNYGTTVTVHEVVKSNDTKLTGLVINEPGNKYLPTIYVDSIIDEYIDGADIEALMGKITDIYMDNRIPPDFNLDVSDITEFENVKDRLVTKVVNLEHSKEFLNNVPHKEFGDLAVICQIYLADVKGGMASITVKEEFLDRWDVSLDEVMDIAFTNDITISEPKLLPMQALLFSMMEGKEYVQEGFLPPRVEESIPMYVLQTEDKINGAKLINQPELMDEIATYFDSDFIVLPSSIHECLIIPNNDNMFELSELGKMVREVNGSEVKPEEVLSDHAYKYLRQEKVLTYEKDGKEVYMKFTKEAKKVPEKLGVKAKLKEAAIKSKALSEKAKPISKQKEAAIEL